MHTSKVLAIGGAGALLAAACVAGVAVADPGPPPQAKPPIVHNGPNNSVPQHPQPKPLPPAGPPAATAAEHDSRIISPDDDGGMPMPFSAGTMSTVTTLYQAVAWGENLNLYAGASGDSPSTGALVVWITDPAGGDGRYPSGVFTIAGTGALTLGAVHGMQVILTDASGAQHDFDLTTDQFS